MSDELQKTIRPSDSPPRGGGSVGRFFVVVSLLLLGAAALERFTRPAGGAQTPPVPMPPLMVEGWLNTDGGADPTRESLAGRHVVLDAWATWCPPCRATMPELAALRGRWGERGVAFLGFTSEPTAAMDRIADFADSVPGFDWPIGYGAEYVFDALDIREMPTLILFDPSGVSVWRGWDVAELERELKRRVKEAPGGAI